MRFICSMKRAGCFFTVAFFFWSSEVIVVMLWFLGSFLFFNKGYSFGVMFGVMFLLGRFGVVFISLDIWGRVVYSKGGVVCF